MKTSRPSVAGRFLFAVAVALAMSACWRHGSEPEPLRVVAAASLTDVVTELAERYDRPVTLSFGASSALARQIRDGAPADVFLSASPEWIDFLRQAGALPGDPIVVARNRLVAVAPRGGELTVTGIDGPRSLLEQLRPSGRIGIADEGVPAGEYARAALESGGLLDAFQPHLVGQSDVRAVLHAVEIGELSAGFVYATDAALAEVDLLFVFDPSSHPAIEYQAAVLSDAADREAARAFLDFMRGELAKALLARSGFEPP